MSASRASSCRPGTASRPRLSSTIRTPRPAAPSRAGTRARSYASCGRGRRDRRASTRTNGKLASLPARAGYDDPLCRELKLTRRELGHVAQAGEAEIVEMTRPRVDDAERADAAPVPKEQRVAGVKADAGRTGDVRVISKPLVESRVLDDERLTAVDRVAAEGL